MNGQISLFDLIEQKEQTVDEVVKEVKKPITNPVISPKSEIPEKPRICFAEVPESEYKQDNGEEIPTIQEIIKLFNNTPIRYIHAEIISDIFELGALSISNQFDKRKCVYDRREEEYKKVAEKYKDNFGFIANLFNKIYVLLSTQTNPRNRFNDWLGELYMQSQTQSSKAGQFFTPFCVSKICAELAIDPNIVQAAKDGDKIITIHEPTVGAGGMVLAGLDILYNKHRFNYTRNVFVDCGDTDKRCVHMTYLQLALAGVPAVVWHRDGLSLETWDCYHTPALCMQWLRFKPLIQNSYAYLKDYMKGKEIDF